MDIKGVFVWTLGSVIRVIQLIGKLKKPFVLYLSITWPIGSRVITWFLQWFGSLGSLAFHLFLVLTSFAYTSRNSMSMEFSGKHKWEIFETYNYVIKSKSGSFKWMAALISYSMAGSVGLPKLIYLAINILDH